MPENILNMDNSSNEKSSRTISAIEAMGMNRKQRQRLAKENGLRKIPSIMNIKNIPTAEVTAPKSDNQDQQ